MLKEAIKRRKPDFSEGRYGFRTFGNLLEEAQARGLLEFGRDEKSGAYVYRSHGQSTGAAVPARSEMGSERASQGAAVRHDFHAVATAPDLPTGGGDGQGPAGPSRGRRSEGADRADLRNAPRSESHGSEQADAPAERPASRYFSQPVMPEAAPLPDVFPEADDGAEPPAEVAPAEPDGVDAAAPRRSRARSNGDTGSGRSAGGASRKAATPRARGARAVADASDAAGSPPSATAAPELAASGAEPAKPSAARPRSRTRKPADKPAE